MKQKENTNPAIELKGLTKRFGDFIAVDGLSLTVRSGEIFGLLGPNGSGKTTIINMISGLSKPTSGEATVLGHNIIHDTRVVYAALGSVPQETALYEELNAWTNLSIHWNYILDLKKKEGKTVLLTTNYLEEANALCDRIAIIDHDKLVALDTPINLKRRYGDTVMEIETASSVSAQLSAQLRTLPGVSEVIQKDKILKVTMSGDELSVTGQLITIITQEINIKKISQREPNLEEIFLSLTGSGLRD